jgi:hypothetical protein
MLRGCINEAVEAATECEESDDSDAEGMEDSDASSAVSKEPTIVWHTAIENLVCNLGLQAVGVGRSYAPKEPPIDENPLYLKLSAVQQENAALTTSLLQARGARTLVEEQKCQAEKELADARAELAAERAELERLRAMVEKSSV